MTGARKSWAGTSIDDRRAARREQLIAAAFELVAESGAAALSVRAVCRTSGLTERYFYESFADREALLVALQDSVATAALEVLAATVAEVAAEGTDFANLTDAQNEQITTAIVHAFTSHLLDDPRRARILLTESFADPTLTQRGLASVPTFAEVTANAFAARWAGSISESDARLNGRAAVGALVHLYLGWLQNDFEIDRDRLERHAVALIMAVGRVSSGSA